MIKNVTDRVKFGLNDEESLPLTKCVCGKEFESWDFVIGMDEDTQYCSVCPSCGAKLFFRTVATVYQVED